MCNLELFSKTSHIYNIEVYHVFLSCRVGLGVAISLTATNLINDRQSGLFDRSYAAGTCVMKPYNSLHAIVQV